METLPRILILGGTGHTGRLIAHHLLEHSPAALTLAARRLDRAQTLADELNHQYPGRRVSAIGADASEGASLRRAFSGHTLVLVAAPTSNNAETVIRSALDMGVDYLDVQLSAPKLALLRALSGDIERAGRCFITEAGFHPGLPAALVRFAAAHLERIETAITLGYLNMGKDLPYSEAVDEVAASLREYNGQVFKDGTWTDVGSYDVRIFDFGGDIGRKRCFSMFFEELRALPSMLPSLRETGFYLSETHWMVDWLITPITLAWLKIAPNAIRPAGKLFWWGMGTFHKPPYRVELQVHASGHLNGLPARVEASVAHADGYQLTAIPVAASLLQYLDGSRRKPGLWMMGHLVEPRRLMEDMKNMGIACSSSVHAEEACASPAVLTRHA